MPLSQITGHAASILKGLGPLSLPDLRLVTTVDRPEETQPFLLASCSSLNL